MNRSPNHIPIDQLQAYLDQSLDQDVYQEIESHLDQCSACRDQFSSLETVFTKLDNLPDIELEKDFSMSVITRLSEESKFSPGITWTLIMEALGAATVIGLLIPAIQAVSWLPQLIDTQTEIRAAINIFLTQLASSWLVWWTGLRLNFEQFTTSLISFDSLPVSGISPWILVLAAASIGILANYLLLRFDPLRNQNHNN
jgi:hypothetical protein